MGCIGMLSVDICQLLRETMSEWPWNEARQGHVRNATVPASVGHRRPSVTRPAHAPAYHAYAW